MRKIKELPGGQDIKSNVQRGISRWEEKEQNKADWWKALEMSKKGTHDVVRSCTLPVEALSIVRALWLFHAWESKWPCWFYSAWCKGIGSSAVKRKDNNSMGHSHSEKKEPKLWRASEKKNRSELFGCATFFSFYKWSGIVITNRKKGSILLLFFFFRTKRFPLKFSGPLSVARKASNKAKVYHDSTMMPYCAPT